MKTKVKILVQFRTDASLDFERKINEEIKSIESVIQNLHKVTP